MGGGEKNNAGARRLDPATTAVPLLCILALCALLVAEPARSTSALSAIRAFLGDSLGVFYLAVGLGSLLISLWIALSDIGGITLGRPGEKPRYGFFTWGAMLFTCGLAADILFYSLCEWIYYAREPRVLELGSIQDWASTYPLFHWGPIPWSFYVTLTVCFGFMLHVRGVRKQKYSEACRPILGDKTDLWPGRAIDVLAVFALVAGTATTFSVATPLLSEAITHLIGVENSRMATIAILLVTCATYTTSVMHGIKGISLLSRACMYLFGTLLAYVLFLGGQAQYIMETGFAALGNMFQNFIGLSTWTDALRTSSFPQNWTIFYWAYWMVWCVAAPFFMGDISRGRTVRQVVFGAYLFGLSSTLGSFIILGNYGLGLQMTGKLDGVALFGASGSLYQTIMAIIDTLPAPGVVMLLLIASMIAFYATSFDSITLVASVYSYREFREEEEVSGRMKLFWAVLLILLPIALIFSEESMNNLQTVSIIAAFPIAFVIILIVASFIRDARRYIKEMEGEDGPPARGACGRSPADPG